MESPLLKGLCTDSPLDPTQKQQFEKHLDNMRRRFMNKSSNICRRCRSLVGLSLGKKALTSAIFGCLFHLTSTEAGGCHFCAYSTLLVQTALPHIHVPLQPQWTECAVHIGDASWTHLAMVVKGACTAGHHRNEITGETVLSRLPIPGHGIASRQKLILSLPVKKA